MDARAVIVSGRQVRIRSLFAADPLPFIFRSGVRRGLPLHIAHFVRPAARKRNHVIDLVAGARAGRKAGRRARVVALEARRALVLRWIRPDGVRAHDSQRR
jgi:hypothetical protein